MNEDALMRISRANARRFRTPGEAGENQLPAEEWIDVTRISDASERFMNVATGEIPEGVSVAKVLAERERADSEFWNWVVREWRAGSESKVSELISDTLHSNEPDVR